MKDPTSEHFEDIEFDIGRCVKDGKHWPCPVVRRWRATPEYRIGELEATVQRLGLSNAGLREEGSRMRKTLYELDLIVNGGLVMAVSDLMRSGSATLTVSRTVDFDDASNFDSSFIRRTTGREEFTVVYHSTDGSVWKNKQLIERRSTF